MDTDFHITPIAVFHDNYIWVIHNQRHAVVIDPGVGEAVTRFLLEFDLKLIAILITHHHHDHVDGLDTLCKAFNVPIYGPASEVIRHVTQSVHEGNVIHLKHLNLDMRVLDVPGHTAGHIAYYAERLLFSGDTLFGCGCGRLFEGTPAQMLASLTKLGQLPGYTQVYCAHEYTLSNIAFALTVDSDNLALQLRAETDRKMLLTGHPTIPTTIAIELATNPFLRCHLSSLRVAAEQATGRHLNDIVDVFGTIRALKNDFVPSKPTLPG